ncbi:family 20 glycosylhydrolase [Halosquirtibacter xylanolyticus]|uniref:family 20 glycosylhydrolase n=1 Tax=Halosquirtibacter xylanolyticus TaxID=3374599 RepID=UPI00374A5024|nr:family 20 glycosylhydrolase [Prolixibacteraceae bacterium]
MKKTQWCVVLVCIVISLMSCKKNDTLTVNEVNIIPNPQSLTIQNGHFKLSSKTTINIDLDKFNPILQNQFHKEIDSSSLSILDLKVNPNSKSNSIILSYDAQIEDEAYELLITEENINIKASSNAGAFYALQTIKQMIPAEMLGCKQVNIPCLEISDKPAFKWRGYMLDVSRHFFPIKNLYEVIDHISSIKMNRFHIHLADDQGWRIEIDSYPQLNKIGSWRVDYINTDESKSNWWGRPAQKEKDKATYGGYYTKKELKALIKYAQEKHIEIIPEIDVPGHSQEILASYPFLSCFPDKKYHVATGGVFKDNTICPSNPKSYEFLDAIITEVAEIFPSKYLHIGGDECNKKNWNSHTQCKNFMHQHHLKDAHELQSYFIKQVEKIVNSKGKELIGWDEIIQGGLSPNATVMSWRGEKGGINAAKQGHDVIMAPNYANYLDLKQGQPNYEPNLGYSSCLLSTCYNYHVIPKNLNPEQAKHILGTEGCLWTESISDWNKWAYMTFPRIYAVAENGWTNEEQQNFDHFIQRLRVQLKKLDKKNIRYAKSVFNPRIYHKGVGNKIEIKLDSELNSPEIHYTLDGTSPTKQSPLYKKPITIDQTSILKAGIFKDGELLGNIIQDQFIIHDAKDAKVINLNTDNKKIGLETLVDLSYGLLDFRGDNHWCTFDNNMDVEIQLCKSINISKVQFAALRFTHQRYYLPTSITIEGSSDGINFKQIGHLNCKEQAIIQGRDIENLSIPCKASNIKYVRVHAKNITKIPKSHSKQGQHAKLRIDEIVIL